MYRQSEKSQAGRYCLPGQIAWLLLVTLLCQLPLTQTATAKENKRPPAIEFETSLPWLNVSRPLTLQDLRGKVVILDFWTYGCINCIHVLEDFRRLEHKYQDKLAIIGIHTPKFDNEKNIETLRRIVVRYGIEHPVVNDVESTLGIRYGMRAWPTQIVIDPEGNVLGQAVGEIDYPLFVDVIDKLLQDHAAVISEHPLPVKLEKENFAASRLAAPGKIAVSGTRVAISDTLHHRIVITDKKGKLLRTIGGKESGFRDGAWDQARFLSPQGLVFSDQGLFVADTGNHSIRYIDLASGEVSTVAGNGRNEVHQGQRFDATSIGLRSPWGLALRDDKLFIAMAGIHQIWQLDLSDNTIYAWAGSGRETIDNGPLMQAGFSQPSGLSIAGDKLYVADAEASAVRVIDLRTKSVDTLVGTGLFDFGDKDGKFKQAQLQHALGVAAKNAQEIYIADTYNHKLKLLDLQQQSIETVAGNGKPDEGDGQALLASLNEPGGIAVLDNTILISDTNNNRIMQYDPEQDSLQEWQIHD